MPNKNKAIRLGLGYYLLLLAVRSSVFYNDYLTGVSLIILGVSVLNYTSYDSGE